MQHTINAEGFGVRLRPVCLEDGAFIVWLRNLEHARGKIGDSALHLRSQQAWLEEYFLRPGDYYFIVESLSGMRVGTFGLYCADQAGAEAGRWIIVPGVPAGVPSAMLACVVAFDVLKFPRVFSKVVATNHQVVKLDEKLGFRQTQIEHAGQVIDGQPVDLVHLVYEATDWPANRRRLERLWQVAERRMQVWNHAHSGEPPSPFTNSSIHERAQPYSLTPA
jgi:RimJ/RimL family protein N-acetyltransferase